MTDLFETEERRRPRELTRAFVGTKTFITSGARADFATTAVRTGDGFALLVRHRFTEMARQVDTARTYVRHVAQRVANGERLVTQVAMAKNTAVLACDHVVDQAVQSHGGLGYLRDADVERHYRDARILGIGGGTTEIMNEIIAKQLGV
ncbi:hypothetical protein GCM10010199_06280 [Dactylosporangium roseum]